MYTRGLRNDAQQREMGILKLPILRPSLAPTRLLRRANEVADSAEQSRYGTKGRKQ